MTSQTDQQLITIHVLSNISRGKSNQAMKFGQLIEYNASNFFFHAERGSMVHVDLGMQSKHIL